MSKINEDIKIYESLLKSLRKQAKCKHEFIIEEGDNLSTTGPTGLYKDCKKCEHSELIGYLGQKGPIFFEEEKREYERIIKKVKKLGLNDEEISLLSEKRRIINGSKSHEYSD